MKCGLAELTQNKACNSVKQISSLQYACKLQNSINLESMFRTSISCLFIFSLLFMGIESAMDFPGETHPHGGELAHVLDSDHPATPDAQIDDSQGNNDHCSHCCHGHAGSIASQLPVLSCDLTGQKFSFNQIRVDNFAQAPPTPPPTV